MKLKYGIIAIIVCILAFPTTISPTHDIRERIVKSMNGHIMGNTMENKTQYWALLVAVGIYANNPDMNRPSMLRAVDDLYNMLLVSPFWNESHIKVIKGKNATVLNIMAGFSWLAKHAGENDVCLIYLTTHGFPILFDLPPRDEKDGMDEALAAYRGFLPFPNPWSWEPLANPFGIITDDEINFMLNRIHAKGIAMIVDSCHSGGFNDNWSYAMGYNLAYEIGRDLRGHNRVVLTSVREDETSYGSFFSDEIIKGLEGYADTNKNGYVSAEEAFYYARNIILNNFRGMHPQIFDDYPGELDLTSVELPPSVPDIEGNVTGQTNVSYVYNVVSEDPEGDKIRYEIDWGDSHEITPLYESGQVAKIKHSWSREGTYEVKIRAIDEHGARSNWNNLIVTMAYSEHKIDQRQVNIGYAYLVNDTRWLAQSFVPTLNDIKKIELALICWAEGYTLDIEIRDGLNGNIIAKTSQEINPTSDWQVQWVQFEINANLVAGNKYYIVCHSNPGWGLAWVTSSYDAYSNGEFYQSRNGGENWDTPGVDACFVTYG